MFKNHARNCKSYVLCPRNQLNVSAMRLLWIYVEIDVGLPLLTLLQPGMPTDGAMSGQPAGRCHEPVDR